MRRMGYSAVVLGCAVLGVWAGPVLGVRVEVDETREVRPISPYIYGVNSTPGRPSNRLGGNRWTAYNWENNASNAGSDWHHQSDDFLSKSDDPGAAVLPAIRAASKDGQAIILTVPIVDYVAGDKRGDGDVNQTPDYLKARFKQNKAKKGAALTLKPDAADDSVYQDEFVNWVETKARTNPKQVIFYSLDNEPDLWSETHARIHPKPVTYAELVKRTIDFAGAIKGVKADAVVFGAVNYGWNGYKTLQNAPDANGRDFHDFFLAEMKRAEAEHGRRLVDALDVHWYPEAQGGGKRITEKGNSPEVVEARVQAPRSLWDPTYTEKSWITEHSTKGPIRLIPRLREQIEKHYPGTKIGITEYTYGGGDHISGGIAEADALGIFAKEGVFAANWWDLGNGTSYVNAAFDLYLNFDGNGSRFGDTSVRAVADDPAVVSAHAAVESGRPGVLSVVLINRSGSAQPVEVALKSKQTYRAAQVYRITGDAAKIVRQPDVGLKRADGLSCELPAYSVTLVRLDAGSSK